MEGDAKLQGKQITWKFIITLAVLTLSSVLVSARQAESKTPIFAQKPHKEQVHLVNTTVKLPCKVKGKPRPFLTWFKDGVLLDERENGRYIINRFSLVIQNIQKTDAGVFGCRAQNQFGESWGNATIRVVEEKLSDRYKEHLKRQEGPPTFSPDKDVSHYVARPATQDIQLDCNAHGYPSPTITWLKDGVKSDCDDEDSNCEIEGFKLKINNLVLKDAGNYTCIVENRFGHISWSFTVDVLQRMPLAPMIEGPMNQTVTVGEDARFECKVLISDAIPQLQWLRHYMVNGSYTNKEGEPYVKVLQQSGFNKNIGDPKVLVIHNVTHEEAGWYTCLVANIFGINYVSAWLTVINEDTESPSTPVITGFSQQAVAGREYKLNCSALSRSEKPGHNLTMFSEWKRNGVNIMADVKYGVNGTILTIRNLSRTDNIVSLTCIAFEDQHRKSPESIPLLLNVYCCTPQEKIDGGPVIIGSAIGSTLFVSLIVTVIGILLYRKRNAHDKGNHVKGENTPRSLETSAEKEGQYLELQRLLLISGDGEIARSLKTSTEKSEGPLSTEKEGQYLELQQINGEDGENLNVRSSRTVFYETIHSNPNDQEHVYRDLSSGERIAYENTNVL